MKKIFMVAIVATLCLSACNKKTEGTHTHEDGSEHADHETPANQEEFNAADSAQHHDHGHPHADSAGHAHPHPH